MLPLLVPRRDEGAFVLQVGVQTIHSYIYRGTGLFYACTRSLLLQVGVQTMHSYISYT